MKKLVAVLAVLLIASAACAGPLWWRLSPGWNMIGFGRVASPPLPVEQLTVLYQYQTYTFAEAVEEDLIAAQFFTYDPRTGYTTAAAGDALRPTRGYWILAHDYITLMAP